MMVASIDKLSKICARLASSHDGERAAAALLATQIIEDLGDSWAALIIRAFETKPVHEVHFDEGDRGWHVPYCEHVLHNHFEEVNDWQLNFLRNLKGKFRNSQLTEKQAAKLHEILEGLGLEVRT